MSIAEAVLNIIVLEVGTPEVMYKGTVIQRRNKAYLVHCLASALFVNCAVAPTVIAEAMHPVQFSANIYAGFITVNDV